MKLLPWNWLKKRVRAKIKCCGYFSHPLDYRHETSPETLRPTDTGCRKLEPKIAASLIITGKTMGRYLLKAQVQMQSTGAWFCMFL